MKAFIFDTETTGLVRNHVTDFDNQPEIIEFYGATVDLKTGKKYAELEFLIKPRKQRTDKVMKETKSKISDELLENADGFEKCAPAIRKYIETSAPVVIAHNASFDKEMVDLEFERIGQMIKWPRAICTVEQTIHLTGQRMGLTVLHEYLFNEKFAEAHRAKADTQALIRCCIELFNEGLIT
jgi:DNA polymerase III subunit alpha